MNENTNKENFKIWIENVNWNTLLEIKILFET